MNAATTQAATQGTTQAEPTIRPADLDFIIDLVSDRIGVQLEGKAYLIESRLQALVRDFGDSDLSAFIARVRRRDPAAEASVVDAMTTNETSFFRDQHPFDALVSDVIPELLRQRSGTQGLTIWNAACSSGQESYTIAMLLHEYFPHLVAGSTIISTDVSPAMVERTRLGEYSRFEINRGLPTNYALKYFSQSARKSKVKPELARMIDVREMNLLEPWIRIPRCDLVLLRNVLIYFPLATKQHIVRRIRTDVLKPGGALMLGSSESTRGVDEAFEARRCGDSTFFYPKGNNS